jgi:hypothetical protein
MWNTYPTFISPQPQPPSPKPATHMNRLVWRVYASGMGYRSSRSQAPIARPSPLIETCSCSARCSVRRHCSTISDRTWGVVGWGWGGGGGCRGGGGGGLSKGKDPEGRVSGKAVWGCSPCAPGGQRRGRCLTRRRRRPRPPASGDGSDWFGRFRPASSPQRYTTTAHTPHQTHPTHVHPISPAPSAPPAAAPPAARRTAREPAVQSQRPPTTASAWPCGRALPQNSRPLGGCGSMVCIDELRRCVKSG